MKKTLVNIGFVLLTICLIVLGVIKLNYILRPTDTDSSYRKIQSFYEMPDDSFEVMIFGSSHAFTSINPMELYNQYGIGAYNCGTNWEKINTTKLFLNDSLQSQTPKLVLIETFYADSVLKDQNMNGEIFYTRFLRNSEAKRSFLKQCFENDIERWVSYYIPIYAFHDNWISITQTSFTSMYTSTDRSIENYKQNMGFSPSNRVTEIKTPNTSPKQKKFTQDAVSELDEIIEMCREKNIDILFFTAPYERGYSYSDAMIEYAKKNGYPYINLFDHMDEIGIDPKTDFKDTGHLNTNGAAKVTSFIGDYIDQNYDLTDMRLIEGNIWQR